jgi:nicotinamidase-related amidase
VPHLDVDDCVLVVIDAQPGFYGPQRDDVDRDGQLAALDRAGWVCGVAAALGVPIIVTEEDVDSNGPTARAVSARLPAGTRSHAKAVFGANDNPEIDAAFRAHGRGTVAIVGMETDVCIAHSALGWAAAGIRAVVVRDAVFSAGAAHDFGLLRLAADGIELLSAKELYYEWLRDLASVRAFDAAHPDLARPPGFSL